MSHRISIVLVATSVTIVGALGILILGGFIFQPRRHRNDRMLAAGALKALGVALDHYAGGTFKPLPERVGEIPSEFGNSNRPAEPSYAECGRRGKMAG